MVAMHYNRGDYYRRMARQRGKLAKKLKVMLADIYVSNPTSPQLTRLARIVRKVEASYLQYLAMEVLP